VSLGSSDGVPMGRKMCLVVQLCLADLSRYNWLRNEMVVIIELGVFCLINVSREFNSDAYTPLNVVKRVQDIFVDNVCRGV
jgi:hypothetical protein